MNQLATQFPFPFACQRWRDKRGIYVPPDETIRTSDYDVAPIPFKLAKEFVLTHHYSGSYPNCRFRYGLFKHGELNGVAVMSVPQHPNVLTNVFPGNPNDSTDLGRFVLLDSVAANGETWFLARCRKLLKQEGLIGMIAFADDQPRQIGGTVLFPGHIGNIYQADNAVLVSRGARKTLYLFPDGKTFEKRAQSKLRKKESGWEYASEILIRYGADKPGKDTRAWMDHWLPRLTTRMAHPGNLKYAWKLKRSTTLPCSRPYPKRELQ